MFNQQESLGSIAKNRSTLALLFCPMLALVVIGHIHRHAPPLFADDPQ
jgi:hypothetical protein